MVLSARRTLRVMPDPAALVELVRICQKGAQTMVSPGHQKCRIREFARWDRAMLESERQYLSRCMLARAFLKSEIVEELMHDLTDIDYLLQYHEKRVNVP